MKKKPELRQRKKMKTSRDLVEAAFALFDEKGFDNVTVEEIAHAAGVSRRTYFRYFPTKESVVFPERAQLIKHFYELIVDENNPGTPLQKCRSAAVAVAKEYMKDSQRIIRQHNIVEQSPNLIAYEYRLDVQLEKAMAAAFIASKRSTIAQRRNARLLAGASIGIIRVALREWFEKSGRCDLAKLGKEAFDRLEKGFD